MADALTDATREFFAYDEDFPLDAVEEPVEEDTGDAACFHVTFASVHDQRVPSLLTLPSNAQSPYPVIIILHGAFGHKTSPNQIKRSAALVAAGFATLRIDGQYSGERASASGGPIGVKYCYRNRDAMIQTAIDLMRGVDYLVARDDIDAAGIGFAGFSLGGVVGAIFCALDPRVRAAVLGVTGGDFDKLGVPDGDERVRERLRRAYLVIDPVRHVSGISPRPLLMINAADDEVIPRAATEALYEAAREPKRIVWYDCGHASLPDEYLAEMVRFFASELA